MFTTTTIFTAATATITIQRSSSVRVGRALD
jgi:hypothetical protein